MANLDGGELLDFTIGDFRVAWNAVASLEGSLHRGNFMFGLQAMLVLELASRCCDEATRRRFGAEIQKRDARYFTRLPGKPPATRGFQLPTSGNDESRQLLCTLFDVVRNGVAHQYQPTVVTLDDGHHFHVALSGADHGLILADPPDQRRRAEHLQAFVDVDNNVWINLHPDILFTDVVSVVATLNLPRVPLQHLSAPMDRKTRQYAYGAPALTEALRVGNHFPTSAPVPGNPRPVPTGTAPPWFRGR